MRIRACGLQATATLAYDAFMRAPFPHRHLLGIDGIGEAKVDKYSEKLLAALSKFASPPPRSESP